MASWPMGFPWEVSPREAMSPREVGGVSCGGQGPGCQGKGQFCPCFKDKEDTRCSWNTRPWAGPTKRPARAGAPRACGGLCQWHTEPPRGRCCPCLILAERVEGVRPTRHTGRPPQPCAHSGSAVLSRGEQSWVLGSGQNVEAAGGLLQLYLQWPQPPPHAVSPAGHTPSSRAQA